MIANPTSNQHRDSRSAGEARSIPRRIRAAPALVQSDFSPSPLERATTRGSVICGRRCASCLRRVTARSRRWPMFHYFVDYFYYTQAWRRPWSLDFLVSHWIAGLRIEKLWVYKMIGVFGELVTILKSFMVSRAKYLYTQQLLYF